MNNSINKKPDPNRIRKITESIIGLPTLPTVISKMIELVDNPRTSASALARLISTDQTLTARLLKLANSAYYGFPREISTVNMAIVVLGFNTVKDMGLSLSVFDVFKQAENSSFFDIARFWEHSIACGIASRMIARHAGSRFAAEAFVAGLLHDIGKVILNQYFHKDFVAIMKKIGEGVILEDAENEIIGTSHAVIGGWLAEKWNLPKLISESIEFHHEPWEARKSPEFIALISLANYICHLCGLGNSCRKSAPEPDFRLWDIFQLNSIPIDITDVQSLQDEFMLEFDKSESFLTFIQGD
jgi:putative nucleotidyltransferase with HDIG domain